MKLQYLLLKDIKNIVYDVKALVVILIMPIVLMSILGAALQNAFGDDNDSGVSMATIGIVKKYDLEDELYKVKEEIDLSTYSNETIKQLNAEENLFGILDNEEVKSFLDYNIVTEEEGRSMLQDTRITALLTLPEGFIYNNYMLLKGASIVTDLEYTVNTNNEFFADIVLGFINDYVDMTNTIYAQQNTLITKLISIGQIQLLDNMKENPVIEPVNIQVVMKQAEDEDGISSFQYYAAAIMCMFLLYSAGIGGRSLLEERRNRTIPRLSVGGNNLNKIVVSNFFRVMLLVGIQSSLMIIYSSFVLKVSWGNTFQIILIIIISAFAIAGLGMFIGVITLMANNYKVANIFEFLIIYVMALIGGSFLPVEMLPEGFQKIDFLSLNGQALKLYINNMNGLPFSESLLEIALLIGFGILFIVVAMLLIKGKGKTLTC